MKRFLSVAFIVFACLVLVWAGAVLLLARQNLLFLLFMLGIALASGFMVFLFKRQGKRLLFLLALPCFAISSVLGILALINVL